MSTALSSMRPPFSIKYFTPLKKIYNIEDDIKIGYIQNLFVNPNYRNKSICKLLITIISNNLKSLGFKYILSEIKTTNTLSSKCFTSNNFKNSYILSYKDEFFYIKKLT